MNALTNCLTIDLAPQLEWLLCEICPISRKFTSPVRKDALRARTCAGVGKPGWEGAGLGLKGPLANYGKAGIMLLGAYNPSTDWTCS
jgi:hypothetical protein